MVKLVQLLCPQRHCLVASMYEEERSSFEEACTMLRDMLAPKGPFNPWCALCGSHELHFEQGNTSFKTLVEAGPTIDETARKNAESRALLESLGMTYEQRKKN